MRERFVAISQSVNHHYRPFWELIARQSERFHIIVDDGLLEEVSVVVFRIQFQRTFSNGDLHLGAQSIVPGLFLPDILIDNQMAATGQQKAVLGHDVWCAIPLSYRAAKSNDF